MDSQGLFIQSSFGAPNFAAVNIIFIPCSIEKSEGSCEGNDAVDRYFKESRQTVLFEGQQVDMKNFTDPMQQYNDFV